MSKPFHITTRVNGETTDFRVPIDDPFVRHTVQTEWRLFKWLPWPRVRTKIEVLVDGVDQTVINAVFRAIHELDTAVRYPDWNPYNRTEESDGA